MSLSAIALPMRPRPQTPIFSCVISSPHHCCHDAIARDRHLADSDTQRMSDSIADRRCNGSSGSFSDAQRGFSTSDDYRLNLRYVGKAENWIIVPALDGETVLVPASALLQSPTCGLDNSAFDLVAEAIRMDHVASIHRAMDRYQTYVLINFDTGDAG